MSKSVSTSTDKRYGLAMVCRVWGMSRATVHRHIHRPQAANCNRRRPGPVGAMPDAELVIKIKDLLGSTPFHGEGYRKVWARLRHNGTRTSPKRVLRLMRENSLLVFQRRGAAKGPRAHDGTISTAQVDEMWGTDMTSIAIGEGNAAVFIAVDHCSVECIGIHASLKATRHEALEPIRQGVRRCFGSFEAGAAGGLKIRHDHGSQYMSRDFQAEIKFLGAESSPSFVRSPEGNGCAERFIRTLKENLLWIRRFDTIEELRTALLEFQETYNSQWIVQKNRYLTPNQVRTNQKSNLKIAA